MFHTQMYYVWKVSTELILGGKEEMESHLVLQSFWQKKMIVHVRILKSSNEVEDNYCIHYLISFLVCPLKWTLKQQSWRLCVEFALKSNHVRTHQDAFCIATAIILSFILIWCNCSWFGAKRWNQVALKRNNSKENASLYPTLLSE